MITHLVRKYSVWKALSPEALPTNEGKATPQMRNNTNIMMKPGGGEGKGEGGGGTGEQQGGKKLRGWSLTRATQQQEGCGW
jgi:hypothetical protein